jgi:hypothetical protein
VDDALEASFQYLRLKMLLYAMTTPRQLRLATWQMMLWRPAFNTSSSRCCCKQDYPEEAKVGYLVDDALEAGFQYLKLKMLL